LQPGQAAFIVHGGRLRSTPGKGQKAGPAMTQIPGSFPRDARLPTVLI